MYERKDVPTCRTLRKRLSQILENMPGSRISGAGEKALEDGGFWGDISAFRVKGMGRGGDARARGLRGWTKGRMKKHILL